jgi:hypothetical protein
MRKLTFMASAMTLAALFLIQGAPRASAAAISPASAGEASAARKTEMANVYWRYGWRGPGWYGWRGGWRPGWRWRPGWGWGPWPLVPGPYYYYYGPYTYYYGPGPYYAPRPCCDGPRPYAPPPAEPPLK